PMQNNKGVWLAFFIFILKTGSFCQQSNAWLLPGITYQDSSGLKFLAQYGANPQQSLRAVYLQAFIKAGKHITFNPAYFYLKYTSAGDPHLYEHTMMNAIIFTVPLKHFIIEDRNLIWNRFRKKREDLHYYRNRIRII